MANKKIRVRVELTALAMVRQVQYIEVPVALTQDEIESLAKEHVGDHVWEYEGVQDETVEVVEVKKAG